MCLTVSRPSNRKLSLKCFKVMYKQCIYYNPYDLKTIEQWVTPVWYAEPIKGVLKPVVPKNRTVFRKGDTVSQGLIHAFTTYEKARKYTKEKAFYKIFPAIAYGVVAYGDKGDLVCKKLVIPSLVPKKRN